MLSKYMKIFENSILDEKNSYIYPILSLNLNEVIADITL